MRMSRREFVAAGLAGAAGLYPGTSLGSPQVQAGEDGYKLWLRYAPLPPAAVQRYRETLRAGFIVQGRSATARAMDQELRSAGTAMLRWSGSSAESNSVEGALIAGAPSSSSSIRTLGWDA